VAILRLTKLFDGVYELGYWTAKEQRLRGYTVEAARTWAGTGNSRC
jgi:hypothetical protein